MTILTPELRQAIAQSGDEPLRLVDPETNTTYVLMRAELYEQSKASAEVDDIDIRAMYPLIDEVFGRDGWDDPAMDIYNDLDPRRQR